MNVGAARSALNTLVAIGVITLLVVLCCGCALGAKSSSRDESHVTVEARKSEEIDRQVVATKETGPVTSTTVVPRVVSIDGHDRLVYEKARTHYGPARSALASSTKKRGTETTDTKTDVVAERSSSWHFGPPWWAGIAALAGVALAAPALWSFLKARIGL